MVKRALLVSFLAVAAIPLIYAETPAPTDGLPVPAGTMVHCRTLQTLTTKLNFRGDAFSASVSEPVAINGQVAIPVGATLSGHIVQMDRPGRIKGVGRMRLVVDQVTFPQGRSYPLGATLISAYGAEHVKVTGDEGLVKGPSSRIPDLEEIGAGTVGGTLLGLLFAHPLVGVTAGLTATTVDRMRRRGKDLTIPIGTQLNYQLTRELSLAHNALRATASNDMHRAGE